MEGQPDLPILVPPGVADAKALHDGVEAAPHGVAGVRLQPNDARDVFCLRPPRDSPAGIEAALAAGAQAIAVTADLTRRKFRDSELLDRSHVVDDPRTLPALVRRLTG